MCVGGGGVRERERERDLYIDVEREIGACLRVVVAGELLVGEEREARDGGDSQQLGVEMEPLEVEGDLRARVLGQGPVVRRVGDRVQPWCVWVWPSVCWVV